MAYAVDAQVLAQKRARPQALADLARRQPRLEQLPASDYTVGVGGQLRPPAGDGRGATAGRRV